jgi:hypothetical protein
MAVDSVLNAQVLATARRYYEAYDQATLQELLVQEWAKAEGQTPPVRSGESRGVRIWQRLMRNIASHAEVASVTSGMVVADVIQHLTAAGIDVIRYEAPTAIIVALIVRSMLDDWKDDSHSGTGSPPSPA